ncbi:MAG: hypothetical protein GX771_06550 [Halomonadaceae bacterium]|nr:hypothetical protein [Halomonadaceae bacterium]
MLTGWQPPFRLDRGLSDQERSTHLPYDVEQGFTPDETLGMTGFNGTYVEFLDRTFKIKGMAATLFLGGAVCLCVMLLAWLSVQLMSTFYEDIVESIILILLSWIVLGGISVFIWTIFLRKDLFQYVFYPVRFNRKTRKIYFFQHDGPGGTMVLPWGDPSVYFHIGRGTQNKDLFDLRCHVLDRNRQVQQTFTVGHFWDHENRIREEWELIRRYMEDGPAHCFDHPADRMIALSTRVTWRNCWLMVCLMMGTTLYPLRWNLMFPIYGALTLSRWLTMKSCRAPVFPPEVEAECAIEPGDPYVLPEPSFMAEFATTRETDERSAQRFHDRQRWK